MKKAMLFLGAFLFAGSASAAINSLVDDFESEDLTGAKANGSVLNKTTFNNWNVLDGTVDLKKTGTYDVTCNGSTYCVDLDGSTFDAGILESKDSFVAGEYEVKFSFSGNQRGDGEVNATDDFTVQFVADGTVVLQETIAYTQGWTVFDKVITLGSMSKLQFFVTGGDNEGVMLDDISVSKVPVPAAAFLFAPALLGFMGLRRKVSKTA
jgi:hypothetical protein